MLQCVLCQSAYLQSDYSIEFADARTETPSQRSKVRTVDKVKSKQYCFFFQMPPHVLSDFVVPLPAVAEV